MAHAPDVISHWNQLLEGISASPQAVYTTLETAIARRAVPDISSSRVEWTESGLLSANRQYLRISRGQYRFDICAAPFGSGFFLSWWLTTKRPSPVRALLACFALVTVGFYSFALALYSLGLWGFVVWLFFATGIVLGGVMLLVVGFSKNASWTEYVLMLPVVGTLIERLVRKETFYRIDTALMFQEAIHAAVVEIADGLLSTTETRGLSELQRKPIMHGFFGQ